GAAVVAYALPTAHTSATYTVDAVAQGTWASPAALGTVAAGDSVTVVITATVDPSTSDSAVLSNTATVSSATSDPNGANDSATATTDVDTQADLTVLKTDSPDPVIAGNQLTYTIVVANAGPSDAQSVSLADTLPTALHGATYTHDSGAHGPSGS